MNDAGPRRARSAAELLIRVLATAAVWSVALAVSMRLRHPFFSAVMISVAVAVSLLIWLQPVRRGP